jgi:precorrin-2 dehydrogenase/sirohydrochlorin ferrochelatase
VVTSDPIVKSYAINLDLNRRLAVVVGAGPVGCRKAQGLLDAGARVRLVTLTVPVETLPTEIELHVRAFEPRDLDGATLAFAATGVSTVDQAVLATAREAGVLANVAADPAAGDFHVPAVLRRGDLQFCVATGGSSPGLAKMVRDRLGDVYGPEWALVTEIIGALRSRKLTEADEKTYNSKVLDELLAAGLPELLTDGRSDAIDLLLTRVIGKEVSLAQLGISLRDNTP